MINKTYTLKWDVEFQGINVADAASGAVGDITVKNAGKEIVLGLEVTERPIEVSRVTNTFEKKISPNGLKDYLFVHAANVPDTATVDAAKKFFPLGHEVN